MSRSVSIAGQLKDVWDGYTGGGESGDRPDWMGSFTLLGECELFLLRDSGFRGRGTEELATEKVDFRVGDDLKLELSAGETSKRHRAVEG